MYFVPLFLEYPLLCSISSVVLGIAIGVWHIYEMDLEIKAMQELMK